MQSCSSTTIVPKGPVSRYRRSAVSGIIFSPCPNVALVLNPLRQSRSWQVFHRDAAALVLHPAPLAVGDDAVRRAVIGKLGWIKRQQANFHAQPRQGKREMIEGESHYFQGQRYRARIVGSTVVPKVVLNKTRLELHVRSKTAPEEREWVLHRWYRARLKELVVPLLEKWQPTVGVEALHWGHP